MVCTGPVTLPRAGGGPARHRATSRRPSPSTRSPRRSCRPPARWASGCNEYYATEDEYMAAVAEALREEYLRDRRRRADPAGRRPVAHRAAHGGPVGARPSERRARGRRSTSSSSTTRCAGIPPERVRLHTCYGLNHGPRLHDVPSPTSWTSCSRSTPAPTRSRSANPRHQHEWRIWEDAAARRARSSSPASSATRTTSSSTRELIADGIVTYAGLVGRENVIAGADCGFSSRAIYTPEVHPTVVWAKFEALAEGARLATEQLW